MFSPNTDPCSETDCHKKVKTQIWRNSLNYMLSKVKLHCKSKNQTLQRKKEKTKPIKLLISHSYINDYQQHSLRVFLIDSKPTVTLMVSILFTLQCQYKDRIRWKYQSSQNKHTVFSHHCQIQTIDTGMVFHFFTIHSELPKCCTIQNQIIYFDAFMCRISQITFMFH